MGSKPLGLRVLREIHGLSPETLAAVLTIDDSNDSRSVFEGIQSFARAHSIDLHVARNRNDAEQIIQNLAPDLCLVAGWYWLISDTLLSSVPHGFIGIHNSLLPKYRGAAPLIWAMLAEEPTAGFSLFSFTAGMDEGPVWAQRSVKIGENDYVADVLEKLERATVDVLRDQYPEMLAGRVNPVEQQHDLATYSAQRVPADGNIDWTKPAREVYAAIRAQSHPYPGAFTYLEGQILKIWRARLFEHDFHGSPGQIARISGDGVYVTCGDNRAVILEEVELGAVKGMSWDLIKSIKGRLTRAPQASSTS